MNAVTPTAPAQAAFDAFWGSPALGGEPPSPLHRESLGIRLAWEAAAQAAIDAATEGTIRALGFTLEDVARFIAAQAPDDGRHPAECPCQFCAEDRREAAAQDDEDDDSHYERSRRAVELGEADDNACQAEQEREHARDMAAEDGDYDTCEPTL